jgi:hypothetical protein
MGSYSPPATPSKARNHSPRAGSARLRWYRGADGSTSKALECDCRLAATPWSGLRGRRAEEPGGESRDPRRRCDRVSRRDYGDRCRRPVAELECRAHWGGGHFLTALLSRTWLAAPRASFRPPACKNRTDWCHWPYRHCCTPRSGGKWYPGPCRF